MLLEYPDPLPPGLARLGRLAVVKLFGSRFVFVDADQLPGAKRHPDCPDFVYLRRQLKFPGVGTLRVITEPFMSASSEFGFVFLETPGGMPAERFLRRLKALVWGDGFRGFDFEGDGGDFGELLYDVVEQLLD